MHCYSQCWVVTCTSNEVTSNKLLLQRTVTKLWISLLVTISHTTAILWIFCVISVLLVPQLSLYKAYLLVHFIDGCVYTTKSPSVKHYKAHTMLRFIYLLQEGWEDASLIGICNRPMLSRPTFWTLMCACCDIQQRTTYKRRMNVNIEESCIQRRPVNVKRDARCVMGKVGGRQKPKEGELLYIVSVW